MNVEEIQNQVEVALMAEHYYSVAKAYMLYRQKHLEDREVRDKLKFLLDYCDASNPATGSKYDANANGRTGDRFMSLVKRGQIANCCQPNALMTLKEYPHFAQSARTDKLH